MPEIRALTGLRGLAALCVLWGHLYDHLGRLGLHADLGIVIERLFLSAGRQVDLFFVLSGFILALSYGSWFGKGIALADCGRFLRRRLARVWPLHAVMLLAVVVMVFGSAALGIAARNGLERFDLATLPAHLLMVHAWGPFIDGVGEWNPPSWSVSVEFAAYLLFPLLMLGYAKLGRSPWPALLLAAVLGLLLDATMHWEQPGFPGVVRGVCEFALGAALAGLAGGRIATWLATTSGSLLALVILGTVSALVVDISFLIALAAAPLLLSLCGRNGPSRFFGSTPMHYLGEISYSIYLGQFLFTSILFRIVKPEWMAASGLHAAIGVLAITAAVVLAASLSYRLVERPCRRLLAGKPVQLASPSLAAARINQA